MQIEQKTGWIDLALRSDSPNFDQRENHHAPEAIIIHCISLPPGEYGGDQVLDFFANRLNASEHEYFAEIAHLNVSAHFFIRRSGQLVQHVSCNDRAWHAGESFCLGKPKVNDFSIGIELEGLDTDPEGFSDQQYQCLNELIAALKSAYPKIGSHNIFSHSDIAAGRKPDPGPHFEWAKVF